MKPGFFKKKKKKKIIYGCFGDGKWALPEGEDHDMRFLRNTDIQCLKNPTVTVA
jgi:hypothetical protein